MLPDVIAVLGCTSPASTSRQEAATSALSRPLLIVQGENDARVKKDQSDRIVDKLKERGVPVHYLAEQFNEKYVQRLTATIDRQGRPH